MSGGGSSTDSNTQTDRGSANAAESIGTGESILQSLRAGDLFRSGSIDPRQRLLTIDKDRTRLEEQLAHAQQRYAENLSAVGTNPAARGNVDALFSQIQGIREQMDNLDSSKTFLTQQAGIAQEGEDVTKQFSTRLKAGLESGNFVDPQEYAAMRDAASGLSQDVATTRGLNRSDVPVMQAIAPTLASMWLGQQNTNKAFYTGAYSANQGLGLQANQGLMQVSNPGLGISSVNAGVRGSNITGTSNTQNRPGGMSYFTEPLKAIGVLAKGVGEAMSAQKSNSCWIAEALYGIHAPETQLLRAWLNAEFAKTWHGTAIMAAYRLWGRAIAAGVRRFTWMRLIFKPLFDAALIKAQAHYGR